MWKFTKAKERSSPKSFNITYRITYKLSKGGTISSDVISINIPAFSEEEAISKLKMFVLPRVDVTVEKIK